MLTNLGHVLMGVTDNVMVGHIGAVSLAAAGLALVAFNVLLLFGIGVSYAITPLVAEAYGEGNDRKVVESVRHGLVVNVINSASLVVVVYFGKDLLYHLDQPPEVVALAIPYLSIVTFSLVPVMVFQTFKQFAEGMARTRVAMIVMIGANIVNVILNYGFIYGAFGLPAMGLTGCGWATFLSRVFMAAGIVLYVYRDPLFRRYRDVFLIGGYTRNLFRKVLDLGVPSGVQFIFEVAAFDFTLVMMGWLGTITLAAHQIAINLATISYMTTAGLAAAATVRVGIYSGSRDIANLRAAAYSLLQMAVAVMACWALLFIAGRHWLPGLYVDDPAVFPVAASLLVIAGLFQLADGTQVVCASALRGLQDVKVPSVYILISYWVIGLPLGYLLTFSVGIGPAGIWWGLLIGLVLTAIAMYMRLRSRIAALELRFQSEFAAALASSKAT